MGKTSIDIYGPVYNLIRQMQNASPEDKHKLEKKLYMVSEKAYKEFQKFDDEFLKLKNSDKELEIKIKKLEKLLDTRMENTSPIDIATVMVKCDKLYGKFWDKLDYKSQKYLAMANYLFGIFSSENDFSPSVIEFGRAVENELVTKIYSGYISSLSGNTKGMIDRGSLYGELKSAIRKYAKNNGDCYIPARKMVTYLSYLSDDEIINEYNEALKKYLIEHGVDCSTISESKFTKLADELFDKYRNNAAHAGTILESKDAKKCKDKSKKVLETFMSAI